MQPPCLLLRRRDLIVEPLALARQRQVAPADEPERQHENEAAAEHQLLPGLEGDRGFLRRSFGGEEVDANHRSRVFLNASPTATAADGSRFSGSSTLNFAGSNAILRKGSNDSTVVPNRSCSASASPCTREVPPLRTMRSMRSDVAEALKKSNVFCTSMMTLSVMFCSTGLTSSKVAPSTSMPFFNCSAVSNGRFSSF